MKIQEQFTAWLEATDAPAVYGWLATSTSEQRKELAPQLKKLAKEYLQYLYDDDHQWRIRASFEQRKLLFITSALCLPQKDYIRIDAGSWALEHPEFHKLLAYYCPSWLGEHINNLGSQRRMPYRVDYLQLMEWQTAGYLQLSTEVIALTLSSIIFEDQEGLRVVKPKSLMVYPETLRDHIWYLFQYESDIHWSGRWASHGELSDGPRDWPQLLSHLVQEGKLDRGRLLRESLMATTRNFDKNLTGWFIGLFLFLKPTTEELLTLQPQLFATIHAPHSKPINASLKLLKTLAKEADFDASGFLEVSPVLLTSEVKSVVKSTMIILDRLVKQHPSHGEAVSALLSQVFIQPDESIQTRAAKFIHRHSTPDHPEVRQAVNDYWDSMYAGARTLLQDYREETEALDLVETPPADFTPSLLSDENRLPTIDSIDDLVFLASQAFSNNESYHFDLLPASLILFNNEIDGAVLAKLMPAFQRAYKTLTNDFRRSVGYLDHLLAAFFVDYGQYLVARFPEEGRKLQQLHTKYTDQYFKKPPPSVLAVWSVPVRHLIYNPFKRLLEEALRLIRQSIEVPLLSTPTHTPYWITPSVLVARLRLYQQKNVPLGDADWQIAVARLVPEPVPTDGIRGEASELLQYLFLPDTSLPPSVADTAVGQVAAVVKARARVGSSSAQGSLPPMKYALSWSVEQKEVKNLRYDFQSRKNVTVKETQITLEVETGDDATRSFLARTQALLNPKPKPLVLLDHIALKDDYIFAEANDMKRFLSLLPHYPSPLLAQVLQKTMMYSTFPEEGEKRVVVNTLEGLLEGYSTYDEAGYLFVAGGMLCSDKTARALAAELWLRGVEENTIDQVALGSKLGKLAGAGYAPLKRFTDLVEERLFRVSDRHQSALGKLLDACLNQLPDEPIRQLKKLLEIYRELTLAANPESSLNTKLKAWQQTASLKKIAGELLSYVNE